MWITKKLENSPRCEYQTTWSASWEIYMQVKKQQLELDMEQTGSKLGKEYIKAVYCHPAYLTGTSFSLHRYFTPSVQFSCSVMSDSLQPHEPQHTRLHCPSPTPRVHPNPCPFSQWCHPTISSSVAPFSFCHQSFPASGSFQMSQLNMLIIVQLLNLHSDRGLSHFKACTVTHCIDCMCANITSGSYNWITG